MLCATVQARRCAYTMRQRVFSINQDALGLGLHVRTFRRHSPVRSIASGVGFLRVRESPTPVHQHVSTIPLAGFRTCTCVWQYTRVGSKSIQLVNNSPVVVSIIVSCDTHTGTVVHARCAVRPEITSLYFGVIPCAHENTRDRPV